MILAILDDLLFMSKIRAAASALGATVVFARSADAALAEMANTRPSLVVFDLNNPRTNPLAVVAAMRADRALAEIPTVGFGSHVLVDVLEAARKAGVGEVMAKSAFAQQLPDILARATPR